MPVTVPVRYEGIAELSRVGGKLVGMDVIRVSRGCAIPVSEIEWRFSPSGGPGGQHANRANTRVEARFDISGSPSLGPRQRARLRSRLGDVVRVVVDDERSQARNRAIALERLRDRLAAALKQEKSRRPTKPTKASKQQRLDAKRKRSEVKRQRRPPQRSE
jgi:ribosome-associated protein